MRAPRLAGFAERHAAMALLALVTLVLALLEPRHFLGAENLRNVVRQAAVLQLLALGQLFAIVAAGIDLSVGSVMALAMIVAGLSAQAGAEGIAVVLPPLVGAACGMLNGAGLVLLRLPHPFIMTLAMMYVARGATNLLSGGVPISGLPAAMRWFGSGEVGAAGAAVPAPFLVVLLAYFAAAWTLRHTAVGLHVYAVGGNARAAFYAGVPMARTRLCVYGASGLCAGLAALLLAGRTNSAYPNAGVGAELDAIAAVIIGGGSFFGGRGSAGGAFAGATIIALFRNGLNLLDVSVFWQQVFVGVIILGAVAIDVVQRRWWEGAT